MHFGYAPKSKCDEFFLIVGTTGPDIYFDSIESLNLELLEIIGIGYVIDHYISYFNKVQKEKIYQMYVTDVLRAISKNTANYAGGSYMTTRFAEILDPPKKETRTSEEIIENIRNKLKGA